MPFKATRRAFDRRTRRQFVAAIERILMADAQKFLVTVTTTVFANTLSEAVQVIEQRVKTPAGPDPHYVQVQILNAQPYKEKR